MLGLMTCGVIKNTISSRSWLVYLFLNRLSMIGMSARPGTLSMASLLVSRIKPPMPPSVRDCYYPIGFTESKGVISTRRFLPESLLAPHRVCTRLFDSTRSGRRSRPLHC